MRYGRLPRTFSPAIPHWSALKMGAAPITVPETCSYTGNLPTALGCMLNDRLGDCAEAGYGHALQVWTAASGKPMLTEPNSAIEALYGTQGYVPGNPSTDRGTVLQSLLSLLVKGPLPANIPKITAFIEIDPTNSTDIDRATYECGLVYIGFNVPAFLQSLESPGSTWSTEPWANNQIVGGHCVISAGYTPGLRQIISWGARYRMTNAFWDAYVDEAYALISPEWLEATGSTPLGLTPAALEQQMAAIRMTA
ncbi:MAG: hypothetical protein ACP5P4_16190 [Steroidobacteraceae bacterium]